MRRAKSPLAALFLTVFIDLVGFGILIPLQPYLALEFHATNSGVTGLNWAYSAAQFLMAPIWGRLSDRIGRRPVMLVSIFGSIFTQALFGATQLWHHALPAWGGLTLLYVARIGAGACGANVATAQAYVADVTPPEGRAKGMGLIGAAFGLGFIVGPALGGGLDHFGHAVPLFFAAGLSLVNFVLAWGRLPETVKPGAAPAAPHRARLRELFSALGVPGLGALLAVQFAVVWSFSNMESTMALMVHDRFGWEAKQVAGLFTAAGVVLVIFQGGLVGRLTARFGERALLFVGIAFEAIGMALSPYVGAPLGVYGAICWLAAGSGLCNPSLSSLISRQTDPRKQGSTMGFASSMSSLGRIFGPLWGGLAYDRWLYPAPYLSAAAVLGVTLLFGLVALRKLTTGTGPVSAAPG
ncbi:MAG TPA: MFS transporter [Myxococcales bacterium]|nr:MFS transporter [Myxococcales bacterium]